MPTDKDFETYPFCKNCLMWEEGVCRRNPPVAALDAEGDAVSIWPETDAEEWCGSYMRRNYDAVDVLTKRKAWLKQAAEEAAKKSKKEPEAAGKK